MHWKFHSPETFSSQRTCWEQLHSRQGGCPVLAWDFVEALVTTFGTGSERLGVCSSSQEPVAMAIFVPTRRGAWETFQPSQAPLGLWLQNPGLPIDAAARSLFTRLPGFGLLAGLTQLDPDLVPRPVQTAHLRTSDYIDTARITIDRSFDDYWQQRGKNLQQNLRKQRTRMQKDGITAALDVITEPSGIAQAIHDYGRLESAGWKASGGTAVHSDNAQGAFYRRALERACARGAGCVFRYRFGEVPVAMDLCVRSADTIVILKTAYDESLKGYSPAMLMRQESFARLFGDGRTRRIEFYGRVMDWHTRLTEEIRTLYHVNLYRWGFLPRALEQAARWRQGRGESSGVRSHDAVAGNAS
jgi:CelD/BcsL family acetyltransferase involved in cellulose biosynthesis